MATFDATSAQIMQEQRRQQLAQMLLGQGLQQEPTQTIGNVAIQQSPFSALAKGLMAYQGLQEGTRADQAITNIALQKEATDNAAIQKGVQLLNEGDQRGALAAFSASPKGQAYAAELVKRETEPAPNDQRIFQWLQTQPKEVQEAYKNYKQYAQKPEQPYHTAVPTSNGIMIFDNRTGKYVMATDPGAAPTPSALPPQGAIAGSAPTTMPPATGAPPRLLPVAADPKVQGSVEHAKAEGKATGEAQGNAQVQYGNNANMVSEIDRDIERMRAHPGLSGITGVRGSIPDIPGTDAANARALLQKLQGGVFLQARQALKGGGQITDYEGAKAEEAYGRMQTAQSKEALLEALGDYQEHIHRGLQLLDAQGRGQFGAQSAPAAAPKANRFQVEVVQ